jgi:hypothetical protein
MPSPLPISRPLRQSSFLAALSFLDLNSLAKTHHAISHFTSLFHSASTLLRLLYLYVFISPSLISTSLLASQLGLGEFSDDILRYRFKNASDFVLHLVSKIMSINKSNFKLKIRDATLIKMQGSGRKEFILHSEYNISNGSINLLLTSNKTGEGFDKLTITK